MKKYMIPSMEETKLNALRTYMIGGSVEGDEILEDGGDTENGGIQEGDAKNRLSDEELEEILGQQKDGWNGGLW